MEVGEGAGLSPSVPGTSIRPQDSVRGLPPTMCVPLGTPNRSSKPMLETKNYIRYVDKCGFISVLHSPPSPPLPCHPRPWAPEIGMTASSSSSLPSSRSSGATMGWGPIRTTQALAPDVGANGGPGPPTEDSSLGLWLGRRLSRAGEHA